MSSNPFEPPRDVPAPLPPNRAKPTNSYRSLGLWLVLILVLVAISQIFSPPPGKQAKPASPPAITAVSPTSPWAWAIPGAVYGLMLVGLLGFRSKLPARYRSFELRTMLSPMKDSTDEGAPAVEKVRRIRLDGSDGERKVRLEVNDKGIHWHADRTAFLHGAHELHVSWDELESASAAHGSQAVAWLFVVSAVVTGVWVTIEAGIVVLAIAGVMALWQRWRPSGTFSFVTPTHSLVFRSRQIDAAVCGRLLHAIRTKRPTLAPKPGEKQNGIFKVLLVEPFVRYSDVFVRDATLDAKVSPDALEKQDAETQTASRLQMRMFSLWTGTICGVGPMALGLGTALFTHEAVTFVVGWLPAWIVGLILVTKLIQPFARFSGMLVQLPQKPEH